jgi:hypothetical protein
MLASFAASLPLRRPSSIATLDMARYLLTRSEGTIGELAHLLMAAAVSPWRAVRKRSTTARSAWPITPVLASGGAIRAGTDEASATLATASGTQEEARPSWLNRVALCYHMEVSDGSVAKIVKLEHAWREIGRTER